MKTYLVSTCPLLGHFWIMHHSLHWVWKCYQRTTEQTTVSNHCQACWTQKRRSWAEAARKRFSPHERLREQSELLCRSALFILSFPPAGKASKTWMKSRLPAHFLLRSGNVGVDSDFPWRVSGCSYIYPLVAKPWKTGLLSVLMRMALKMLLAERHSMATGEGLGFF